VNARSPLRRRVATLARVELDPDALLRLRRALRERGRPSLAPPDPAPAPIALEDASADTRAAIERVAPACELLHLMMSADGSASSVEREVLRGAVRALTDGQLSGAVIDAMLARFDQALARDGQAARLAHVAAQLSGDRADAETAFSLAAALALADAGANPRELELLEELGEQLGLSRERRQALIAG
jgi:uncharacterized tellurite resistance protein B-like protein